MRRLSAGLMVLVVLALPAGASAAGDANEASCPAITEAWSGFRSSLPDCRAYEMVSPPFKDGGHHIGFDAVSIDGSRFLTNTTSSFGGSQGQGGVLEGTVYMFTRSASGWLTFPINPSQALFPAQQFLTTDGGLGRSLWLLHGPADGIGVTDLYARETDGSFVKVGPLVPPSLSASTPGGPTQGFLYGNPGPVGYRGASSDLSHVLFATRGSLRWSGDTTTKDPTYRSLYQYVGTGHERPELVGLDNEGRLISDCETNLGASDELDTYNAVSGNGHVVFFTALGHLVSGVQHCLNESIRGPEVSELYARLGGVETVAISEPSPEQCAQCDTSVKMPAVFQGASIDGSKVFFLSEQGLLEGATGMNLYEYDFDGGEGRTVVRVSRGATEPLVQGVARVSEDGSHVYFVARGVLTEGVNREGRAPVAGEDNLYVFERGVNDGVGHLVFVATLSEADGQDWSARDVRPVQATPDGRFLVFQSAADLVAGDTSNEQQVFEYDAQTEALVRVSVGQAGYASGAASANEHSSSIPLAGHAAESRPTDDGSGLVVSSDGSLVVFSSTGALTAGAVVASAAGLPSVYEYRSSGSLASGGVYLVAAGTDPMSGIGLDASGHDVFFGTSVPLLASDGDDQVDLFDARADGGFPVAPTSVGCVGEGCRGPVSEMSSFGVPGSVSQAPGGAGVPSVVSGGGSPPTRGKPLSRKARLVGALRACRRERGRRRRVCEARARRRYASKATVNAQGKG